MFSIGIHGAEASCDPKSCPVTQIPRLQNKQKKDFTAAEINSALSPYLMVGFFTSSFPWKIRRMDRLCVRIAGKPFVPADFRVCCSGLWTQPGECLGNGQFVSLPCFPPSLNLQLPGGGKKGFLSLQSFAM